jgi:hypothetical protein
MAATPDGKGYWMVASDGGIFTFGDASFYGSEGGTSLNQPIVGMAATPDGKGYWMVASDGGIFAFGDAGFFKSLGAETLNAPIVSMAATPDGKGYWMMGGDGGIFTFGDAGFYNSAGGTVGTTPFAGIAATPDGKGYWLTNANGGVDEFGDAEVGGSTGGNLNAPVVGIAAAPGSTDPPANVSYPPGSTGYDISNFQCGNVPPAPFTIGIVSAAGAPSDPNPCLTAEGQWAGYTRELYIFMASPDSDNQNNALSGPYGTCATTNDTCIAENFGYNTAADAIANAKSDDVPTDAWWLDIEAPNGAGCQAGYPMTSGSLAWSCNGTLNADEITGALAAFSNLGLTGGIYSNINEWNEVLNGNTTYRPDVPEWVANYNYPSSPKTICAPSFSFAGGPIWLVQYTDNAGGYDGDYAC